MKFPLIKTFLPPRHELMPALERVLYSGYIAQGPVVEQFEDEFSSFIGESHALSVNSGTAALHIALILAGVGKGDEVISTSLTAEPTNVAIRMVGANIVYADIDKNTGCLDPKSVVSKITPKTRAVILVDYAGVIGDIEAFLDIERVFNIPIIQDAAHSLGSEYNNKMVGSHFNYVAFSLQAIKHMTTVDGGILMIKKKDEYERAKKIRWFGLDKLLTRFDNNIQEQGFKYHMNDVNATIGSIQLKYILNNRRIIRRNQSLYDEHLQNINGIKLLNYTKNSNPNLWLYSVLTSNKVGLENYLVSKGIACSSLHKRNEEHEYLKSSTISSLPILDEYYNGLLHIPVGWWMSQSDIMEVIDQIKKASHEGII